MNRYFSSADCKIYRTELTPRKLDFIRKAELSPIRYVKKTDTLLFVISSMIVPHPQPLPKKGRGFLPLPFFNGANIIYYLYFLYAPFFVLLGYCLPDFVFRMCLRIADFSLSISTRRPFGVNSAFSVNKNVLIILKEFLNDICFGGKSSLFR